MADNNIVKLDEEQKGPEQVIEQLRASLIAAIESQPTGFVLFFEYGADGDEKIGCRAVGSPVSIISLYHAGGDALAATLRQSLHPSNKNG